MKSYTDIEQSKKLAEFLPIESADMHWQYIEEDNGQLQWFCFPKDFSINQHENTPCWSLSALVNLLDDKAGLAKEYGVWFCYDNGKLCCTKHYAEPIDAVFEMIIKLNELNLL